MLESDISAAPEAESLYVEHRSLLLYIARRKFGIHQDDAEILVHDAVIAFLTTKVEIRQPRTWLVAAMCNACRSYWRHRARVERVEGIALSEADHLIDSTWFDRVDMSILVKSVLAVLSPHDRELLYLHYFQRMTASEIAEIRGTSAGYIGKRISVALKRARMAVRRDRHIPSS